MDEELEPMSVSATDLVIDALTKANMRHASTEQQRSFALSLRELVRMAKVEKTIEIKLDTATALGVRAELEVVLGRAIAEAKQRHAAARGESG
jgi:hypothetical protein